MNLIYLLNKLYNIIYMSKRIDASVWGNSAWHLLHTIGLNTKVSSSNKKDYIIFLNNFKNILPCPNCRENYKVKHSNFLINDETISTKNYQKWVYNIHNMVNDSVYNTRISFNDHIKENKKYDVKKINKFSNIVIDQLGATPSYKELLDCKTYLKCIVKLHPKKIKNKSKKIKELEEIYEPNKLKKWFNSIVFTNT